MSRYYSHINSAREILQQYNGEEPFASFLKKFFSQHKKFGSKDRKSIAHLCYCYFRLGKMASQFDVEERILLGLFLCSAGSNDLLENIKPEWNEKVFVSINEKLSIAGIEDIGNIFPFTTALSKGIEKENFQLSHFQQPDLFLRLRPGHEDAVKKKLKNAGVEFETLSVDCLALPNASKIDQVIEMNKDAVVQDLSSQRVGEFFQKLQPPTSNLQLKVWDCCAASGGKSIMLYDINPTIDLTVSDIRESILINLKKRFQEAGITKYKGFVADLSKPQTSNLQPPTSNFQLIVADVPCSGSGTWGRTPEQLVFFKEEKIDEYVSLQKRIVSNVIPHLQSGGHLLYITCSVFKKENEDVIEFIKQNFSLELVRMETLIGYDKKADTMFAALLRKPL
jgi:16S rRNA (cytosine967-C5)-methyltransferase